MNRLIQEDRFTPAKVCLQYFVKQFELRSTPLWFAQTTLCVQTYSRLNLSPSVLRMSWLDFNFLWLVSTYRFTPSRGTLSSRSKGARSLARPLCAIVVWLAARIKGARLATGRGPECRGTPIQNRTINNFSNLSPAGSWVGEPRFGSARVGK